MGLVRLSAFILQSLSAEPGFGAKLNAPVDLKLSVLNKYSVPGSLADFLIVRRFSLPFSSPRAQKSVRVRRSPSTP